MTRPITTGIDGTEESIAALDWAAREAVRRDVALRVVHAWRFQPYEGIDAGDRDTQEGWARDAVGEAVRTVTGRHTGLDVSTEVVEGGSVDVLVAAAADAELLVLGSRGHGPVVGFLLGSVGQQVIAEAARPVVLVRAGDQATAEASGREVVVGQEGDPEDSADVLRFAFETAAARGPRCVPYGPGRCRRCSPTAPAR